MRRVLGYLLLLCIVLLVTQVLAYTEGDCIRCHSKSKSAGRQYIDLDHYRASVHGKTISCLDCHQDVRDSGHIENGSHKDVNCAGCHHGQKNHHTQNGTVACKDCHTAHRIFGVNDPRSSVHWKNTRGTCGKCHPEQARSASVLSFLNILQIVSHPKQNLDQVFDKSMCTGCHQGEAAHGEDGPVNNQNCYQCHSPLGRMNTVLGYVHPGTSSQTTWVNFVVGCIYLMSALAIVVFFFRCRILSRERRRQ